MCLVYLGKHDMDSLTRNLKESLTLDLTAQVTASSLYYLWTITTFLEVGFSTAIMSAKMGMSEYITNNYMIVVNLNIAYHHISIYDQII